MICPPNATASWHAGGVGEVEIVLALLSCTPAFLHDHIGDVPLDNVVLVVKVQHGHGTQFRRDAARVHRPGVEPPHPVLIDHGRVKGRGRTRDPCQVGWAAPLAVIAIVTGRRYDPVIPPNKSEVNIKLLPTAEVGPAIALQTSLPDPVLVVG